MSSRTFRFGVVAAPTGGGDAWLALARRVEELGYATLLMPDVAALAEPFAALGMAAGATTRLRVGTFVLAAPLRTPHQAAWAGHSLSRLSGGRFEFGIGTGRPDAAADAARLGMPFGSAEARLGEMADELQRRREAFSVSYISVNSMFLEQFAPVVELLDGR